MTPDRAAAERVARAAYELGKYDDFGEPLDCEKCRPADPRPFEAARRELHEALKEYAALRAVGEGA